jgi:hypothetical protein
MCVKAHRFDRSARGENAGDPTCAWPHNIRLSVVIKETTVQAIADTKMLAIRAAPIDVGPGTQWGADLLIAACITEL